MRMMTEGGDWCRSGDCSLDDHQADYPATALVAHRQAENACCPHGRPSMAAAAHFFFTNSTTCPWCRAVTVATVQPTPSR